MICVSDEKCSLSMDQAYDIVVIRPCMRRSSVISGRLVVSFDGG